MEDKRIELLSKGKISKAVITMALPSIIGLLVTAIYNIVDTMFVAWLGTKATGATQVVLPIVMALGAVGLTFGIGGGSYISRLLGERDIEKAKMVSATGFYTAIGIGILSSILGIIYIDKLLMAFGATEAMLPLAREYGIYILVGGTAQVVNMTLNNMLRAEGSAKNSMIAMLAGAVLNIALDPILIFKFDMGIKGAAVATSISQFVTMSILIYQYIGKKAMLSLSTSNVSFNSGIISETIKMGMPSFVRQILVSISMALLNHVTAVHGGEAGIAAIGIVSRTMMIIMYVIFGLSQGFQPVAGFNFGAGDKERLKGSLRFTSLASVIISMISVIAILIFDDIILSVYRPSAEVLYIAKSYLIYLSFAIVMMSFSNVIGVYYQAIGRGKEAIILSTSRQGIFLLPFLYILPQYIGMRGVFLAQPLADLFTFALTILIFAKDKGRETEYSGIMKA